MAHFNVIGCGSSKKRGERGRMKTLTKCPTGIDGFDEITGSGLGPKRKIQARFSTTQDLPEIG
jgi:hypothetical protein